MLEILISSSVLILVLVILRLALRDKISARLQYALWLLVLVRLLVPVSFFHSPVSVAEAAAPVTERAEELNGALVFFRSAPVRAVYSSPEGEMLVIQDAEPNFEAERILYLTDAARYVWYAGMAVMAVWFLFVNLRMARRLKQDRRPYVTQHTPPVYVADGIPSPCLFGLLHPAIYLTEQAAADPAQARQIVAHEKTHLRHGDLVWALLRSVCLAVWWFNPLVWLAAALSRQDCELACDEGTIKALGEDVRYDYGRTLVGMAKVGARPSDLLCGATTMTTGKKSLKARVERIAKAPKTSVTVAVIALLIAAAAVGCTFGGAAKNGASEAPDPTPTPMRQEQEIAAEASNDDASATDAEFLPAAYSLTILDPDSGDILAEVAHYQEELEELYALYSVLKTVERPLEGSDVFSDAERSYAVRFYNSSDFTLSDPFAGFQVWEDGTFLLFEDEGGASPAGVCRSQTYAAAFLDILDRYHSGSAEAARSVVSNANIDAELLDFFSEYVSVAADTVDFDTWADYLYFENDYSRKLAQDASLPFGEASILGAEQINGDLAAFLVQYGRDPYPCLQFAGRYDGRLYVFRNKAAIPEELREGLDAMTLPDPAEGNDNIMAVDTFYWDEVEKELGGFARSSDIDVFVADGFDEAIPEDSILGPMTPEDYIYGTDGWKFDYDGAAVMSDHDPSAWIKILDDSGRTLWIMDDADALMIEEADGSITCVTYRSDPVDCADMIRHLLPWARGEYPTEEELAAQWEAQMELSAQNAIAELGYFGLAELEPVYREGGYAYPFWIELGDPRNPTGPYVVLSYGTKDMSADLRYERVDWYGDPAQPMGEESIDICRSFFAASEAVTDLKVGTLGQCDGFITDGSVYGGPRLVWYDADEDLLFSLIAYHFDGGQNTGSYTADELVALAKSVSRQ